MMKKNKLLIVFYIIILSILTSCADVKQGLTGQNKKNGTDEFLVQKKLPLVLPPDFEKLPKPTNEVELLKSTNVESSNILKIILGNKSETIKLESNDEESILKKIIKNNVN
tara:strand:- start:1734 stop:2066 length:333 start_codon:yes stop_codon:yes gene_type:complete